MPDCLRGKPTQTMTKNTSPQRPILLRAMIWRGAVLRGIVEMVEGFVHETTHEKVEMWKGLVNPGPANLWSRNGLEPLYPSFLCSPVTLGPLRGLHLYRKKFSLRNWEIWIQNSVELNISILRYWYTLYTDKWAHAADVSYFTYHLVYLKLPVFRMRF